MSYLGYSPISIHPKLRNGLGSTAITLLIITGCTQQPADSVETDVVAALQETVSVLDVAQPSEEILATVNGTRIGDLDLSVNMVRTLGESYLPLADSGIEEKILESMIASRAIATEALTLMDEEERVLLEKRVARYREELLVKDYLLNHAEPNIITSDQISEYYEQNPEEFKGSEERLYELVTVSQEAYKRSPKVALDSIQLAKNNDDWRNLSRETASSEIVLAHGYESFRNDGTRENYSEIESTVQDLQAGQMSRVVMQGGAPYLVRLLEIRNGEQKPLSQARAEIKRKLLPASIRKSVKEVSKSVLAKSDVVRMTSAQNSQ